MNKILTILFLFISVLSFGQGATPNLRSGLVHYWKFEETTGTTCYDETSSNADGTNTSVTINQTGKVGQCYQYNGTSGITIIPTTDVNFNALTESYTFSFWIKSSDPSPTSNAPYIVSYWDGSVGRSYPIVTVTIPGTSDLFRWQIYNGSSQVLVTVAGATLWDGGWHLVNCVADIGTDNFRLYVDGELEDTRTNTFISWADSSPNDGIDISTNDANGRYYSGYIDEMSVHSRALSVLEIDQMYNSANGLLYVQENFKNDYNYEKFINYLVSRQYFGWIAGAIY